MSSWASPPLPDPIDTYVRFTNVWLLEAAAELVVGGAGLAAVGAAYGWRRVPPVLGGLAGGLAVQRVFLWTCRRRIGPERASPADLVTLSRGVCAALLVGLMTARLRERTGLAGWVAWAATLWASTLGDWLDGPMARRWGPTRLGGALDIEADSWVTLWSAAYAAYSHTLPSWCLLAPVVRYLHPLLDVRAGGLPRGGGPWWARVTGAAQMGLVLLALAPTRRMWRRRLLTTTAGPISMCQLVVQIALLARRRPPPPVAPRSR
jgi:phosphatidylglycerophosphate synthase